MHPGPQAHADRRADLRGGPFPAHVDATTRRPITPPVRAVMIDRFGGPDVLVLRETDPPEPGPDDVLVRVVAAGTNPVDAKVRAAGEWAQIELPAILGYDASGIVER